MQSQSPIRRVITGHDSEGQSTIVIDEHLHPELNPMGDAAFSALWATEQVPADNNDQRDGKDIASSITLAGGSVIRVVDFLPSRESPMHRTNSIDYGIVLSGEIELELDDGQTTTISAGGVIVQRGTIHLWRNKSTDTICRVIFVLIEALPYLHNGKAILDIRPEDM